MSILLVFLTMLWTHMIVALRSLISAMSDTTDGAVEDNVFTLLELQFCNNTDSAIVLWHCICDFMHVLSGKISV